MCMLNHWLDWNKRVLTNFDHDRQWFNTLIPPSHETAAVTVDCISRLSGPVRLILRYTTVDIHCRDRRYVWDGGINSDTMVQYYINLISTRTLRPSSFTDEREISRQHEHSRSPGLGQQFPATFKSPPLRMCNNQWVHRSDQKPGIK